MKDYNVFLSPLAEFKLNRLLDYIELSLYYRIHNETVEIITVIDNRQNPEEIATEIRKYFPTGG